MVQAERDLDQTGDTGCALGVSDIALDRPDRAGCSRRDDGVQCAKRFDLDHVAEQGAGAVCLEEVDLLGHDPGAPAGVGDDLLLRPPVRRGDAVAAAVAG